MTGVAPTSTVPAPPLGGYHRKVAGRSTTIGATGITTVGAQVAANSVQVWPTAAAAITVASAGGAADSGRKILLQGVKANAAGELVRAELVVTLGATGQATVAAELGWWDVTYMRDASDQEAATANTITATGDGVVLAQIDPVCGVSRSGREWVLDDETAYVQLVGVDFDDQLDGLGVFASRKHASSAFTNLSCLVAGGGANAGRDLARTYAGPTSKGIRVDGPARLEARALAASGSSNTVAVEYSVMLIPTVLATD